MDTFWPARSRSCMTFAPSFWHEDFEVSFDTHRLNHSLSAHANSIGVDPKDLTAALSTRTRVKPTTQPKDQHRNLKRSLQAPSDEPAVVRKKNVGKQSTLKRKQVDRSTDGSKVDTTTASASLASPTNISSTDKSDDDDEWRPTSRTRVTKHMNVSAFSEATITQTTKKLTTTKFPAKCNVQATTTTARGLTAAPAKRLVCGLDGCTHKAGSMGDMRRHQESRKHKPPSYHCLGCKFSFTREDALARHFRGSPACRVKAHAKPSYASAAAKD